jgi:two-component sensor histidine kinase
LRRGARENEALQAALKANKTLVAELQHRVKNNIQVMISLITLSARGEQVPEVVRFVKAARLRLHAMASAQEAVYRSANAGSVSSRRLLQEVLDAIRRNSDSLGQVHSDFDDATFRATRPTSWRSSPASSSRTRSSMAPPKARAPFR